ncbi:MAG: hypothetical protein R6U35_06650, partial [Candidatus Humimicrobiaceae bacterium]
MSKPKKAYLASLGIASLSYEKAKNIAKGLVKKGDLLKEKQEKFIKELTEKAKENSEEIKEKANKTIDDLVLWNIIKVTYFNSRQLLIPYFRLYYCL